MRITPLFRSARRRRHAPGNGPDEARQLAGDRGGDDIGRLATAGEFAIARAQPQLRFPGDLADRPRLLLLPEPQLAADPGWEAVNQAASISNRRAALLPALVRPPRLTLAPLECSDGTSPR
jgi:hypothetical protein